MEDYTLVSYGGAGGQHACLIAENLNIKKILINPLSSFLSAYGIASSNEKYINQKTILCEFSDQNISKIKSIISTLKIENSKNFSTQKISHKPIIYLKYLGTDQTVSLRIDDDKFDVKEKISVSKTNSIVRNRIKSIDLKKNIQNLLQSIDLKYQSILMLYK